MARRLRISRILAVIRVPGRSAVQVIYPLVVFGAVSGEPACALAAAGGAVVPVRRPGHDARAQQVVRDAVRLQVAAAHVAGLGDREVGNLPDLLPVVAAHHPPPSLMSTVACLRTSARSNLHSSSGTGTCITTCRYCTLPSSGHGHIVVSLRLATGMPSPPMGMSSNHHEPHSSHRTT